MKRIIGPLLALFLLSSNTISAIAPTKIQEITTYHPVILDFPISSIIPKSRPLTPNLPSKPIIKILTTPAPVVQTKLGHSLSGKASWYCRAGISICHYLYPDTSRFDAYAAAGPALRRAIGKGWRNNIVSVNGVQVKLVDWCQCYRGEYNEKIIDLYYDVFARTGGNVIVRW